MEKFMAFMDKYITPYAAKMGAQRHLVAVRDAFVAMIPLTIIGSLATLINNAPIKALNNFFRLERNVSCSEMSFIPACNRKRCISVPVNPLLVSPNILLISSRTATFNGNLFSIKNDLICLLSCRKIF